MNRASPDDRIGGPRRPPRASRARWYILLGLLVPFTALTYLAVSSGPPSDLRDRSVVLTTLATLTGPLVGAIARNGQSCCLCLGFSPRLAEICGPVPGLGLIAQGIPLPFRQGRRAARPALWTPGWLAWLGSGPVSFLHAFS